jgi:hypothetical protein
VRTGGGATPTNCSSRSTARRRRRHTSESPVLVSTWFANVDT